MRAIAIVGPLPPPSGGMANQTRQIARLLQEAGLRVELIQANRAYWPGWIAKVQGVRALFRLIPYLFALWRCAGRVDLYHVMANSGWAWHLFAAPAVWIARLRRKPVVVNYRGGAAEHFLAAQAFCVRPTLKAASAVMVPSRFLKEVFERYAVPARIVPNAVDLTRFRPAPRLPETAHLVVARNLEAIYDIATALRAFAHVRKALPQARLTIAGSGPLRNELETLSASLGIASAVHFTGQLDHAEMAALYGKASVLVNPARVDNTPNSLLEAMASGVPIVSTRVGGVPFLVEDGVSAVLVPPADAGALSDAVLRVLGDRPLAERLRAAGLEAAEGFSWDRVAPILFAVYDEVLVRGRAQPTTARVGSSADRS